MASSRGTIRRASPLTSRYQRYLHLEPVLLLNRVQKCLALGGLVLLFGLLFMSTARLAGLSAIPFSITSLLRWP
jgi:hypothetical protein